MGFDGVFIVRSILNNIKNKSDFNAIIRNGKIYRIKYKNLTFLDTLLILNESLDNLSNKFLNNKKKDINYWKMENYENIFIYQDEIVVYLYRDVSILFEILMILVDRFSRELGIDITRNFTIPSIALNVFRRGYLLNSPILILNEEQNKFVKKSYKGGYTNIIEPYMEKGYIFDVNSLYPYIMKTCKMPLGDGKFIYSNLYNWKDYFGFMYCKVRIPLDIKIPPLYRDDQGSLVQGVGVIKGTFFIEEVKNSIILGCEILEVYKILKFDTGRVIFKDYISDMYSKRLSSTSVVDNHLYKLLMNSLYGRFGLVRDMSKTIIREESQDWLNNLVYTVKSISNERLSILSVNEYTMKKIKDNIVLLDYSKEKKEVILKEIEKVELELSRMISSVQISSAISSYARIFLINTMSREIELGNKIYYYDTDSLHCRDMLEESLIDSTELGKFKLEGEVREGIYLSPKVYGLKMADGKEILKFKGLPKNNREKMSYKDYKDIYKKSKKVEVEYVKEIRTDVNRLEVKRITTKYTTKFESRKYKKKYTLEGVWDKNEWIEYKD